MALLRDWTVSVASRENTDEPPKGDYIDTLTYRVAHSRPYSWKSFWTAALALILCTFIRASFGPLGSHFPLTFYFPAILAVGVLAGIPAALGLAIASIVIVWFMFIPPYFQLGWLKAEDFAIWLLFALSSSATIVIAWLCRESLIRLHQHQLAYRTVARELRHRDKNSLAVTEAIVRKTLEHDRPSADAILGRLRAIDYANDLLANPISQTVALKTLIENEFAPYGHERLVACGQNIELPATTARHVLLIMHELATNAAKYGALSNAVGHVLIDWETRDTTVIIRWKEQEGPPVRPPTRKGFGSILMTQSIRALGGQMDPQFLPDGFACCLTFTRGKQGLLH